jgi:hypothetical protein
LIRQSGKSGQMRSSSNMLTELTSALAGRAGRTCILKLRLLAKTTPTTKPL